MISQLSENCSSLKETHGSLKQYIVKGVIHIENEECVFIGKDTIIEHGAVIIGPCFIGSACVIRKGSYIRGNVIIGNGSVIGNSCEIKNSIILDEGQIAHFNYIGDSILGVKAHFSGGAITSNLKFDTSEIKVIWKSEPVKTGLQKFGALVG